MLRLLPLVLSGLPFIAAAAPFSSRATAVEPSFSTTNGTHFTIDGKTGYFAGSNAYWIGFLTKNADVDRVLDNFAISGTKILRIWGFNDITKAPYDGQVYYQSLSASGSTINTGADGLQRLDYVVKSAEARGIKLIINFVNNWSDYGGIPAYASVFGGTEQTWFTNGAAQTQYRKYIAAVIPRYAHSTAVFAWELANEPRCKGCDTNIIYDWASNTSAYIKSLDKNHLVTLGDEGFGIPGDTSYPYGTSEGSDFVKNLGIKDLDFGTFHMYPDSWGVPTTFGPGWIQNHAKACLAAEKPCLLEEYGYYKSCEVQGSWQKASLASATSGMSGDLFWQWGDKLTDGSMTSDDGNTIFFKQGNYSCLVTDHVAAVNAANV